MIKEINKLELEYNEIINKFLVVLNKELDKFEKNKNIAIENYAYVLSRKILNDMEEKYDLKLDVSLINDGLISDLNKVINNYDEKYKDNLIDYSYVEDLMMGNDNNKDKCIKLDEYLKNIKSSYLMEEKFISNLNETFTKRIFVRMVNASSDINKDDSKKILNSIYINVKDDSFGFLSEINDSYVDTNTKINCMSQKITEAMAQLEMLTSYKEQDEEVEYTSRMSRLKEKISDLDSEEDINEE